LVQDAPPAPPGAEMTRPPDAFGVSGVTADQDEQVASAGMAALK